MKYIECPAVMSKEDAYDNVCIFLGGGISNCGNWQQEMVERFKGVDGLALVNPRRANFDITNPLMSKDQIGWEHDHLDRCMAATFWFPFETLCPITLFELGVHATLGKKVFVGCHAAYQRKFDVIEQLRLINPDIIVRDNIGEMVEDIMVFICEMKDMRAP